MSATHIRPLRATVRLQFHKDFTLDDAVPLLPYFASLGISHIYASPLLSARAGSMHGYDVVDPTTVNPELGGDAAL
ncbi:MAG: alpha-amylase family glycosyl hydrolase, partial [Pseudomonas sp.]|nr:alpha-amylase family glycosyl hydrolase [Pseudomonas sp.]